MRTEYRYGTKIRELRTQRGWTQEHLAELAGVTPRTVQRLEKDATLGLDTLMAIAQALETDLGGLRTAYWVAEQKPLRAMTIDRPEDFAAAIRASHEFACMKLVPPSKSESDSQSVEELLS